MAKKTIPEIPTTPVDIQARLDAYLADNPDLAKYVSKIWYVPVGAPVPNGVTHTVVLASAVSAERSLTLGAVCTPETALFLDMILSMLATQPPPV